MTGTPKTKKKPSPAPKPKRKRPETPDERIKRQLAESIILLEDHT